jgi:hypothetical protein
MRLLEILHLRDKELITSGRNLKRIVRIIGYLFKLPERQQVEPLERWCFLLYLWQT